MYSMIGFQVSYEYTMLKWDEFRQNDKVKTSNATVRMMSEQIIELRNNGEQYKNESQNLQSVLINNNAENELLENRVNEFVKKIQYLENENVRLLKRNKRYEADLYQADMVRKQHHQNQQQNYHQRDNRNNQQRQNQRQNQNHNQRQNQRQNNYNNQRNNQRDTQRNHQQKHQEQLERNSNKSVKSDQKSVNGNKEIEQKPVVNEYNGNGNQNVYGMQNW